LVPTCLISRSQSGFTAGRGLALGNNESARQEKAVRITRAGVYLKPVLAQAAHAAVKSKDIFLLPYQV